MPDQRIPFPITDPTAVDLTTPLYVLAPSPTFEHPATIAAPLRGAVRARRWLDMYREADDHGTSDDEALCDLLTDLRHLTDHMEPDAFYTAVDRSYQHYLAEVADARKATNFVRFYTSADGPEDDATWTVYSEVYAHRDDDEGIEGSIARVSTHASEAEAYAEVERRFAEANQ